MNEMPKLNCPRCKQTNADQMRRGPLHSHSNFIRRADRGKQRSRKIHMRCLFCGYVWRSESVQLALVPEEDHPMREYSQTIVIPKQFDGLHGSSSVRPSHINRTVTLTTDLVGEAVVFGWVCQVEREHESSNLWTITDTLLRIEQDTN